jgi:hypothetical protein
LDGQGEYSQLLDGVTSHADSCLRCSLLIPATSDK